MCMRGSGRVVLVGFDGANPELVERYLPELPHFKRLIEGGCWGPMLSTVPVDTPTNWTALATGATAATSGITGFAFHAPGTSLAEEIGPSRDYARLRAAEFLWEAADRQGRRSIVINYPFAWYSRDLADSIIVGGDQISGGLARIAGSGCLCTPDRLDAVQDAQPLCLVREGESWSGPLVLGGGDRLEWSAVGLVRVPGTAPTATPAQAHLRTVPGPQPRLIVQTPDGREVANLTPSKWSAYLPLQFRGEEGWVRFFLVHLSEDGSSLQLFHTMVTRSQGWTRPGHYAQDLLQAVGPYQQGLETDGQMEASNWFGVYGMEADIELLDSTADILLGYAEHLCTQKPDWDYLYLQIHSTDGLNHRRLGHLDAAHPCTTPELTRLADRWLRANYRSLDRILGRAAVLAEEAGAVLFAVSDHSAIPTHTWVDTARPFQEKGWLVFDRDGRWDPTRSRVRKMINHSIYINLKGRQPDGIVSPADYEHVRDEIISILLAMRDPRNGACPIALAARREELASIGCDGPCFGDVVYFMRPGYTNQPASEGCLLTPEIASPVFDDPEQALARGWAFHRNLRGNHHDYLPNATWPGLCSNRAILLIHGPGIRRGMRIAGARTIDIAPTIAALTGMEPPAQCEGQILRVW